MTRKEILEQADKCVNTDRNNEYGHPEDNFALIAGFWSVYLGTEVTAKDVGLMMALLKVARAVASDKADNFVDLAGYAACAGEITTELFN